MLAARRYHIQLTSDERQRLQEIAKSDVKEHADRASAFLLLDESNKGQGLSIYEVARQLEKNQTTVSHWTKRAVRDGVEVTVLGNTGGYRGGVRPRTMSPEAEREMAEQYASGKFTMRELARRHGVSRSTVSNSIHRTDIER